MRADPTRESRPSGETEAASDRVAATSTRLLRAADYTARFQARVLVEALLDGWTIHNERQARRWETSRPRQNDFLGCATVEDQRARWQRMTAVATAYRNRASVAPIEELTTDLLAVLGENEAIAC